MTILRKLNVKRVLSAILSLVLTMTILFGSIPIAEAAEPIRLAENEVDEQIAESGAFYLATTNATLSEKESAPYHLRVLRGGEDLPAATLKLEMIDVSAKFKEDYTIEVLHERTAVESSDTAASVMEALSGDDLEQEMYDDYGNDLSMTDEAAKAEFEENAQDLGEYAGEAWNEYVRDRAADDGIDLDAFYTDSDETADAEIPQSELSLAFEEQTGLIDDRTPIAVSSDSSELGDILQAGYGLEALNSLAEAIEAPFIMLEFAEGETEKIIVINSVNDTDAEGNKTSIAKLVSVSENIIVADTYSALNFVIEDDEKWERPTISFAADSFKPEGGYAKVTLKREGLSTMISSVHLTSSDGTAQAGRDYSQVDTEIDFPYGVNERMVKIPIGSACLEDGGKFTLTISEPVDCVAGKSTATVVIPKGAESYNPKDIAATGDQNATASDRFDANPIDLTKVRLGQGGYNFTGSAYIDGDTVVLHPNSDTLDWDSYGWARAEWDIKSYIYCGYRLKWEKSGTSTSYGDNKVTFHSGEDANTYPVESEVKQEVKISNSDHSFDEQEKDLFSQNPYMHYIEILGTHEGGDWAASPKITVSSITPILRPFEITRVQADTSALQFLDETGKFTSYQNIPNLSGAGGTVLDNGNVKWVAQDKNDISISMSDVNYSWIKHLEVVKLAKDGKTVLDSMRVVSDLPQGTETANIKLTEDLVKRIGDKGFITFKENGDAGLKGQIAVRAVLAPYPADFTLDNDDVRATVSLIEPENKPADWTWHKGDFLFAKTVVNREYVNLWTPVGVDARYKNTGNANEKFDTWYNEVGEDYTVRQIRDAQLEIRPSVLENNNKLIVKIRSTNLRYYDRLKGFFKDAKAITKDEAGADPKETGYNYYLVADTDTIIPNKYYELSVKPITMTNVAVWKQDVGKTSYYENTHYFRTSVKRAENIVELLAPKKYDTVLKLTGTVYYSGATLDQRIEGEAWMPAEGAIAGFDTLHYGIADKDGVFSLTSSSGELEGETINSPLYAVKGEAITYKISSGNNTDYYKTKVEGTTDSDGNTTVDVGKLKVSALDTGATYIAAAVAIGPDGVETKKIPITDTGISTMRVTVKNCGAEYGLDKIENTKEIEILAYQAKNAEPKLLAKASKEGRKAESEDEEDVPPYEPTKLDDSTEVWEIRFTANVADGLNSGDKLYVRLTTDRSEYVAYDEDGNIVKDSAFNATTYPPLDTGDVLIQPAATVPDKYDFDILDDPEFMSDHLKFPIVGSMNAVFKAKGVIFALKPLPNNGIRISFGYMPEKWSTSTGNDDGNSDTGEDYSVTKPLDSLGGLWRDFKSTDENGNKKDNWGDKIRKRNGDQKNGKSRLVPLKSGGAGFFIGIYLDMGRICTEEGESLELIGGGIFGGVMAYYRLVAYVPAMVPFYFGFNGQIDAMVALGVEKDLNTSDVPFEWDDVNVGFSTDLVANALFEAYAGIGICGVIGVRGGLSVNLNFEYWPTVANHYKKLDQMLKDHGHEDGLRSVGFEGTVGLKIWVDFLIKATVYDKPKFVDEKLGFYKDLQYLDEIGKELAKKNKSLASTGASEEADTGEYRVTTQYKQAGDPSVWTGSTPDLTRSTFEQTDDFQLKTGGYDSADPQLFDLGDGKILLVYVDEDSRIAGDDRTVLRYQVYDKVKNIWLNTPGVIQAKNGKTNVNGALEPKLTDAGDKVMITWTAVVLPDADHSDADYMQKYLRQRNVYAAVIDKAALRSASSDKPAQIDGALVSATDTALYNTSPSGVYYKDGDKEYLAVTYLASEAVVNDDSLTDDEKDLVMATNAANNSYVRTARYDAANDTWVTSFDVMKLNSTYDAETKTWTPLEGKGLMTDNNPTVIDLDTTVWNDWLISTFAADEDNDLATDEDRELFVKFENLKTGNATVNQLTDDGEYVDSEGTTHVGTAKARPQLIKNAGTVYLFWQNGTDDVAWIDLGALFNDKFTDLDTGRIIDKNKADRSFVFYSTIGADIEPSYTGFQPFADEKGNLYIVWQQGVKENGVLKQELYAQSIIRDRSADEVSASWSDPVRLTYTDAQESYNYVFNDEPAIAALGSGELLVVCNRFGASDELEGTTSLDVTMHGIHFITAASVKPIELKPVNEFTNPGESLEFEASVKNDGLKTANGFVLAFLMLEKDQYDENRDYAEDFDGDTDDCSLIAFVDFEDAKLAPSEMTTVHVDEDLAWAYRSEAKDEWGLNRFAMPDKLAENGYVMIVLAMEYNDFYDSDSFVFDNVPYKTFEDAVKVDRSYTVHASADTYRHETGSLSKDSFIFRATVRADGNVPLRETDRLVVGPSNFDNADGIKSTAYYLDVPLSALEISEDGDTRTITTDIEIEPERFTYGFTRIYAEIVDKDDYTLSEEAGITIEAEAPYYVNVKDKATDKALGDVITLEPGDTITLDGSYEPSTHFRDGKIVYSVEDANVATVDENGRITAVGTGETKLYASVNIYDAVREYTITVSDNVYIIGDADSDGEVTILDVTAIQRHLAGLPVNGTFNARAADVDDDNEVSIIDGTWIQRYLASIKAPDAIGRKKEYADTEYLITK